MKQKIDKAPIITEHRDATEYREYKSDCVTKEDLSPLGAFSSDSKVLFTLCVVGESPESVTMVIHRDGWGMDKTEYHKIALDGVTQDSRGGKTEFETVIDMKTLLSLTDAGEGGLFYYHYAVKYSSKTDYIGGEGAVKLDVLVEFRGERQLLVYEIGYKTSASFARGAVYQIFTDRFYSSGKSDVREDVIMNRDWEAGIPQYGEYPGAEVSNNMFFGGDLYGIAEKMEYIASLGVTTVYLTPIFEAYSNHKYDTGNYMKVDSMFGGDDALVKLTETACEYGIDIILDGVFNHTGDDSVYFNRRGKYDSVGAYQSENSPWSEWYKFTEFPDEYESWWGIKVLPRVDSKNESYTRFITESVIPKWMNLGVSGWRLDVADELDEGFLRKLRESVKKQNPDGVIIGEVWEDASNKVSYGERRSYLMGRELDSVMNYPLRDALISYVKTGEYKKLRSATEGLYRRYPKMTSDNLLNFLGTHDTERIITVLGGEEAGEKTNKELSTLKMTEEEKNGAVGKLKLAYSILAGLPGVPCIFYGDEVGLEGYRDPFCRRPFPWRQMNEELLSHYRRIGRLRKNEDIFADGYFKLLFLDEDMIVYLRYKNDRDDAVLVAASRVGGCKITLEDDAEVLSNKVGTVREYLLCENESVYLKIPKNIEIQCVKT